MTKKIIIIGAGASGIAAGTKLLENGFKNLTILEAENRIGGRVHTIPFASNVVDMGGQWCHGELNNASFELASPHNLLASSTKKDSVIIQSFLFIESDGEAIDQEQADRLLKLGDDVTGLYKEELESYRGSYGSFYIEKFQQLLQLPENQDLDGDLAQKFLDFFHRYENSLDASDNWFDTSAQGSLHYWKCEGDQSLNWKDKGYKTVLELMMKKLPDPSQNLHLEDCIEFNKTVSKIDWNRDSSEGSVLVTCTDGTSYLADHVIVTVSLGVLKEKFQTLFNPPLPSLKKNAIQGLSIGTVGKIYLEFEKPFWPVGWDGFNLLWEQEDIDEVRKMTDSWLQDVFGFYTVDYQPNILCGWISGVNARRMEMTPEKDVLKGVMFLLRKFLKKLKVPDPIRMERTTWFSNPNFRGSYSFRSIATELLNTSASDLAQPLYNSLGIPVLQFAGEATHDHYYSTVHGAIETGWREANRITDFYSKTANEITNGIATLPDSLPQIVASVDVLILGAGLSGLGAAYQLSKVPRVNYLLLEGQEKVGGRICSESLISFTDCSTKSNVRINAGAQWLHGRNNELYKIAVEQNLLSSELSDEGLGDYLELNGNLIDPYTVKKIDFKIGQILEECEKFTEEKLDNYPASVQAHLVDEFQKYLNELENEHEKQVAKELLDWHIRFQIIDNSCLSLQDVSAKNWGTYSFNSEDCQAHINFKGTFYDILEPILKKIGHEKVLLKKKVENISWGVTNLNGFSNPHSEDYKILVKCSDGSIFQASQVICTFSLGVLKEKMNQIFHPKLPNIYENIIQSLGFGAIDKIYLQFEKPWWGDSKGLQLVFTDELSNKAKWTRFISGFDVLQPGPENTLLGWIGGPGAIEMEKLSDETIVTEVIELLALFTKKTVPQPLRYFITRWNSNEFCRGAYSYVSAACDQTDIQPEHLAQFITFNQLDQFKQNQILDQVDDISSKLKQTFLNSSSDKTSDGCSAIRERPAIIFAGECCHSEYYSTAHGAFHSGMDQAGKLLKFYGEN